MKSHFILYVVDQESSTKFWSRVLDQEPKLNVPGMTEVALDAATTSWLAMPLRITRGRLAMALGK